VELQAIEKMTTMFARQSLVRVFKRPAASRFLKSLECREFSSYSGQVGKNGRGKTEKTALVIGCSGALGSELVSHMHHHQIVDNIIGADLLPPQSEEMMNTNFDQKHMLSHFIQLDSSFHGDDANDIDMDAHTLTGLTYLLETGMEVYEDAAAEAATEHEEYESEDDRDNEGTKNAIPLDVVICTAGGWIPTADYASPDYLLGVEQMLGQNLYPVIAASHIAATRLKPGGEF
jgi:NAD(P)-dependent dehydrogenase (short-subunit alcohol dehydrogenase family)